MLGFISQSQIARNLTQINEQELDNETKLEKLKELTGQEKIETQNVDMLYKYVLQGLEAGMDGENALKVGLRFVDKFVKKHGIKDVSGEEEVKKGKKDSESKMSKAEPIFKEHFGKKTPKEIQTMFIDQLDMTKLGARTYYYTLKGKLGV